LGKITTISRFLKEIYGPRSADMHAEEDEEGSHRSCLAPGAGLQTSLPLGEPATKGIPEEGRKDQSCDSVVQYGRFVAPACEVAGRWSKARHVLRLGRMPLRKMRRKGIERTGNRMDMGRPCRGEPPSGAVQVASGSGRVSTAHDTATRVPFRPWLISEFLFRSYSSSSHRSLSLLQALQVAPAPFLAVFPPCVGYCTTVYKSNFNSVSSCWL
jgi:hypothetical protein